MNQYFIYIKAKWNVMHFVAKDNLFEDHPWTLGYYLGLQSNKVGECMFPTFEESIIDVNKQSDSQVFLVITNHYPTYVKLAT